MMTRSMLRAGVSIGAVLLLGCSVADGDQMAASVEHADAAPVRAWRAFQRQLGDEGLQAAHVDPQRFEAIVDVPGAGVIAVDIDWDEETGGTRIIWRGSSPDRTRAATAWISRVAERIDRESQDNHLCRGDAPPQDDLPEPSLEGTASCRFGMGQFSSALFELEKCGDYETALRILAACVREQHPGGMIRLAWFYENGFGVPQRPERMTHFLRQAAGHTGSAYHELAKLHFATALYFGIGINPDREGALRLMHELEQAGSDDAAHFLRRGYHTAWRRADGSVFADPDWPDLAGDGKRHRQ